VYVTEISYFIVFLELLITQYIYLNIDKIYFIRHYLRDIHLRTDKDGELVIISKKIASKHNAVCLDGSSVPGYFLLASQSNQ